MATPVLLWPEAGEPQFVAPGTTGNFSDGITIEILSNASKFLEEKGIAVADADFEVSMQVNGNTIAHQFKMESLTGSSIWLIADPRATTPNGSFTGAFAQALTQLSAGDHALNIEVKVNGEQVDTAQLQFQHGGDVSKYQALVPLHGNAEGARAAANAATTKAYEQKREEEAAAKEAARYFNVTIKNENDSKTIYIIRKDHHSLSENISEVLAGKEIQLRLSRNMKYDLLFYRQDMNKDQAIKMATIDESYEGNTFPVL